MNKTQNVRYCDWGYCTEPAEKNSCYCKEHRQMVEQAKREADKVIVGKNDNLTYHPSKWGKK